MKNLILVLDLKSPKGAEAVRRLVATADVLVEKAGEFAHGYTYSGHPAACAVAIANIRLIQEQGLVDRVKNDIGPYLQERWQKLAEHPLVGEVRMVGLIGALASYGRVNSFGFIESPYREVKEGKVTGKVVEVRVEEGMRVEEGDVVARLDDSIASFSSPIALKSNAKLLRLVA